MYIIFQKKGGGAFGALIRWWTKSKYCHCELQFSNGTRATSSPGIGVIQHGRIQPEYASYWESIYLPEITPQDEETIRAFFDGEAGRGYDWKGLLFSHVFTVGWESKKRWFCSEICATALENVGIIHYGKRKRGAGFSPEDLYLALPIVNIPK